MRLVIATPLYPPEPGGPATYTTLLEEGLPAHGIQPVVVKFADVRHLPKFLRHFAYYQRVRNAAKNADAVLALDPVSVGLPALQAAKSAKKPFFVKIVGDYAWEQGTQRFGVKDDLDTFVKNKKVPVAVKALRDIETKVARAAVRVIVPSVYLKRIVTAWGIAKEKIEVIHNGIEIPASIGELEKEPGEFLIVSAGRRVPWKGFEAIERIATKYKGEGWRAFIASGLSRAEVLSHIRSADVFVLNSEYEGLSHVLIEAMMLGTPVIVTSAGGNTELVTEETGLLIPSKNDEALERALLAVAKDPGAARLRAEAGRIRMREFEASHTLSRTAERLISWIS
jgi:glycosyltransferase involved in cell wall biosynthesis